MKITLKVDFFFFFHNKSCSGPLRIFSGGGAEKNLNVCKKKLYDQKRLTNVILPILYYTIMDNSQKSAKIIRISHLKKLTNK